MIQIQLFVIKMQLLIMEAVSIVPLDVQGGLTAAKNEALNTVKFLVNNILIPIASAVLVGLLILNIIKAYKKHHGAEPYGENITGIVIIIVILALVVSAPTWMWNLI